VLNHREIEEAEKYCATLQIKTPTINQLARNLSGGNQQQVVKAIILILAVFYDVYTRRKAGLN
jgi:ABC-type sugar transport system ATPase subunit